MTRIVSLGECMVELAPTGAEGQFQLGYAGDTLNTAWYLRRLLGPDHPVDYFTAIGTDAISDQMLGFMDAAGIGTGTILRRPDRTVGLYLIQLDGAERSFAYWRGQSAARTLARDPADLRAVLGAADLAVLSGITLAILPATDRPGLFKELQAFRARGGLVVFDPNLRPRLWSDGAEMTDCVMAMAALTDIALPSFEDEAQWFGDASPEDTARRYLGAGAGQVVVKNGAGEIHAQAGDHAVRITPRRCETVVDTTAAGDSFNAGFLAAHVTGAPLEASVAAGAGLAAKVIGAFGALVAVGAP